MEQTVDTRPIRSLVVALQSLVEALQDIASPPTPSQQKRIEAHLGRVRQMRVELREWCDKQD